MLGLLLPLREDTYVIELDAVQEVMRHGPDTPVTALPGAPAAVLGLMNVRGQVLPVLDTAVLLDLPPLAPAERQAMSIVRVGRGAAGLLTTAMPRSAELGEALGAAGLPTARERHRIGTGVGVLLDLEATLAPDRVAR